MSCLYQVVLQHNRPANAAPDPDVQLEMYWLVQAKDTINSSVAASIVDAVQNAYTDAGLSCTTPVRVVDFWLYDSSSDPHSDVPWTSTVDITLQRVNLSLVDAAT